MPNSFTTNLRLTLQADGENPSTWGDIANTVFQLIEQATAGLQVIPLSTGTTTLSTNNGASDQARAAILQFTGALSGANTVVVPNVSKLYVVYNNTSNAFSVTMQTSAPSASVVIPQGSSLIVFCDGNNNLFAVSSNAVTLGGIAASGFAQLASNVTNNFLSQNAFTPFAMTFNASQIVNLLNGNVQTLNLTGNTTFGTPTNVAAGQPLWLFVTQDATGGRTVGFNSNWLFPNGITPTVDPTPNATTVILGMYLTSLSKVVVLSVLTGFNGTVVSGNITVAQNTTNLNLFQLVGSPAGAVNVTLTINQGVRVIASDPQAFAVDLTGFTTGSVITLINNGYILGRGGNGGRGGEAGQGGSTATQVVAGARGRPGGNAINGPNSGVTVNITNNGFIWAGGGGGGGGGTQVPGGGGQNSNGGGGGGGAGGSLGGDGGLSDAGAGAVTSNAGGDGTWLTSGANGAGGAGAGTPTGLAGGSGGDWGAAGSAGTNGAQSLGGPGGAAGAAIIHNGGTQNFVSGGTAPNVKGAI